MKDFKVDTDGLRNEEPLTQHQIDDAIDYAISLGVPRELIAYVDDKNISYCTNFGILYIGTDLYPAKNAGSGRKNANSRIYWKGKGDLNVQIITCS